MFEDLKKLSVDLYHDKNLTFNNKSGSEAMRNIIAEALGVEAGTKFSMYDWDRNKVEVFQILSVAIDAVLPTILTNQLDSLADVRNVATGDKPVFEIADSSLMRVGLVASGTQDLQRQELFGGKFTVDTDWYGAKAFADFERLMSGEVDWSTYVNRIALSFTNKMQEQIYSAFSLSYDGLRSTRKVQGTYDEDKLVDMAEYIATAAGGKNVAVYGTRSALRQVSKGATASDGMKDEMNKVGYLGTVGGLDLIAIPQAFKSGKEEFALDNKTLLVLPQGEKVVSVVLEGETYVNDVDPSTNNLMQRDFLTLKKYGVQVAQMSVYGMYKIV